MTDNSDGLRLTTVCHCKFLCNLQLRKGQRHLWKSKTWENKREHLVTRGPDCWQAPPPGLPSAKGRGKTAILFSAAHHHFAFCAARVAKATTFKSPGSNRKKWSRGQGLWQSLGHTCGLSWGRPRATHTGPPELAASSKPGLLHETYWFIIENKQRKQFQSTVQTAQNLSSG